MNHWPLPTARKLPSHSVEGDTAFPNLAITCPQCRSMLSKKVAAHRENSVSSKSAQERRFFAADADHWQAVLDRAA